MEVLRYWSIALARKEVGMRGKVGMCFSERIEKMVTF